MSLDLDTSIKLALADALRSWGVKNVAAVTSYEDDTESTGGCETCWYEYAVVRIHYDILGGGSDRYTYCGGFAELMRELS